MSTLQEFTLFPFFPKELRLLIWERTLVSRLLPLRFTNANRNRTTRTDSICLLFEEPHATDIPLKEKRLRLAQLGGLRLVSIDPILALSACHESRDLALRSGYRAWTLQNQQGRKSEVMWNPRFDTVTFVGLHIDRLPSVFHNILELEFPSQVKEIQRLAMPTTNWGPKPHNAEELLEESTRWLKFESLKELVVVLDEDWERAFVDELIGDHASHWSHIFILPNDLEESLKKCKDNAPTDWEMPILRVVGKESEILGETSMPMQLRCFPCPDLGDKRFRL